MDLLEKIFLHVLNLSETGGLVILAVLLLRCVLHQMPKKFSYVLWAIPAVRLLVTISFHGIVKLPERFVRSAARPVLPTVADAARSPQNFGGQMARAAQTVPGRGLVQVPGAGGVSLWFVLACLWLAGMMLFAAKNGYDYYRLRKRLCVCMEWKKHIYLADGISQPFVLAGLPCNIYLPSGLCEEKRRYILMHEQVHVRRGDAFFKLLASLICCVHWFNPLVWLGAHYFYRDMEMSCDEAAAAGLDEAERRAYAQELLLFSSEQKGRLQIPCAFGEKGVKGRIMNLLSEKRKSKAAYALAVAVVVLAAVIFVPNFRGAEQKVTGMVVAGENEAERGIARGNISGAGRDGAEPGTSMDGAAEPGAAMDGATEPGTLMDGAAEPGAVTDGAIEAGTAVDGAIWPETVMDGATGSGMEVDDGAGIMATDMFFHGVPVRMRWRADKYSEDEMEAIAWVVYDSFASVYLEGDRRPEQKYGLDGILYDFETTADLINMFSDIESPMVWRLMVTLPDNWREDKGMGMMQDEESQKQEYDIALAKNAAGEWEVTESAWRVYYDDKGYFRWPE